MCWTVDIWGCGCREEGWGLHLKGMGERQGRRWHLSRDLRELRSASWGHRGRKVSEAEGTACAKALGQDPGMLEEARVAGVE